MLFNDDFIDGISARPYASAMEICRAVINEMHEDDEYGQWRDSEYDALQEGYALLEAMIKGGLIPEFAPLIIPKGSIGDDCRAMIDFVHAIDRAVQAQANLQKFDEIQQRMSRRLGVGFVYEFSQGDLDRIQVLLSELRKEISSSTLYADGHRERLLARLEKLQAETHKKMSNIDKFWSLLGDAGVAVGKFGENSKPMFDRINEILKIVWRTQARAEDLPSDAPAPLPHGGAPELPDGEL
ncbi:hypothetical protein [Achromobacter insuavis]|uniref:hypothetical protein n=1 Tax=Achromobacter insuavis TaxID=1287735 RepID=UPI001F1490E3|nr:hypothetical protein [Achromobacter insuavis]